MGSACITCSLSNCEVCVNSSACAGCKDGFEFASDGSTCVTCNVVGCKTCSAAGDFCAVCNEGYEVNTNDGSCFIVQLWIIFRILKC